MGKVLIAIFDEDEMDFEKMIPFIKEKSKLILMDDTFQNDKILEYRDIIIDPRYRIVKVETENIELTNYEFDILYLLAKSPGQVFPKEQIYNQVWKEPYYRAEDNVMSLIRRIRKKIEPDPRKPMYILTVWGIGYKFNSALSK